MMVKKVIGMLASVCLLASACVGGVCLAAEMERGRRMERPENVDAAEMTDATEFSESAWETETVWETDVMETETVWETGDVDVEAVTEDASEEWQSEMTEPIHRNSEKADIIEEFEIRDKEQAEIDFALAEKELPSSAALDVPEILQNPVLPTGCEAVALTMALQYEGFLVDMVTIADEFLIYNNESDNMAIGYVGDPFSEEGAGCFPPAIAATAESFFRDQEAEYAAYNITGSTLEELLPYVANGTPVIVWGTMYMAEPEFTREDAQYDGHVYQWYRQEHCMVLSGYDLDNQLLTINDPLEGIVNREYEEFKRIYTLTGQNAVVLRCVSESTI